MSATIPEFWQHLSASRLLAPDRVQQLQAHYGSMKGAPQTGNARILGEWLRSEGVITKYQMKVLLAGRSGPFYYGDYRIDDRYEKGRLKGRYRATHVPSGHPVLLDFLAGAVTKDRQLWAKAAAQAENARRATGPQVARLFELVDLVTFKFCVLEQLAGQSLEDRLTAGPLSPAEASRIARFTALGLDQFHKLGQVYGELRPTNLWLTPSGNVKLLAPPLARDLTTTPGSFSLSSQDPSGRIQAAADYLAPELAPAGAIATPKSDIYALGCLLYHMLAGRPPFAGGAVAEKVQRHATERIQPLEPHGVPQQLAQVVTYMMAKDPSVRYQSAGQVAEALKAFVDPAKIDPPADAPAPSLGTLTQMIQQRHAALIEAARSSEAGPNLQAAFDFASKPPSGASPTPKLADAGGDSSSVSSRVGARRKSSQTALLVGAGAAVLMVLVSLIIAGTLGGGGSGNGGYGGAAASKGNGATSANGGGSTATPSTGGSRNSQDSTNGGATTANSNGGGSEDGGVASVSYQRETTIPDNGRSLWASPTAGPPLDLRYTPPGAQLFMTLRPAMFISPQGQQVKYALGPWGEYYFNRLRELTAFEAEEIDQLLVAMQANQQGVLDGVMVVRLRQAYPRSALIKLWGNPAESEAHGRTYLRGAGGRAYYVPVGDEEPLFVVGPQPLIEEMLELGGSLPPLRREMEDMLADTDAARHFNLLFAPNYLFSDGKKAIFSGGAAGLQKPIYNYLGSDKIKSGLLSFHLNDENFFAELRLGGDLDLPAMELASSLHERLGNIPSLLREYYISFTPHPYSARLLAQFPEMVRVMSQMTRSDDAHNQAVLRCYLPAEAAHNMTMALELTLAQLGGGGGVPTVAAGDEPQTVEAKLAKKTSLSFPRDTLDTSLQLLAEDIGVEIVLMGQDLKLDGITKNQSFGLDMNDKPAREILEAILTKANPDKSVKKLSEPGQKLLYVVKPKEPGGEEAIFVTTRAMAEQRGDKIPKPFVE